MSCSESESDTDSVEEVQVKKYLIKSFEERIKQAKAQANVKSGIKRQPGHYHLRDRRHAVVPSHRPAYDGRHWEVEVPSHLQRSTPRLTRYAIRNAILEEQQSRVERGDRDLEAHAVLEAMNKEFDSVIVFNYGRIGMELDKQRAKVEQAKDLVHRELLRKKFIGQMKEELEEERQIRIKLLNGLSNDLKRTPSIEDLVSAMAETNYKRALINTDLQEAQTNLEINQNKMDHVYQVAMSEMLDESLAKVVHTFAADETKQSFEEEKARRLSELSTNANPTKEYKNMKLALSEMKQTFEEVETEEAEKEEKYREKVADMKAIVQEQLVRKVAKTFADKAAAEERARRIQEAEDFPFEPSKNAMRHLVTRVQRQMLLQKFKGKWINLIKKPKDEVETERENETEHDRKLRQQRENQRRPLCVARGDEDD